MNETRSTRERHCASTLQIRAGLVAPVLFVVGLVIITWVEWDFLRSLGFKFTDHGESAWPSSLAQGPIGWAQIINYAAFGLLVLVFFSGLKREFTRSRSRRTASVLLTGFGIAWILVAFPEDGPPFGDPSTWAGYLHGFGVLGLVLFGFSGMIATAIALRGNDAWRGYSALSFTAAAGVFIFLVVLVFALELATTLGVYGFFGVMMVWVEAMALRLSAVGSERSLVTPTNAQAVRGPDPQARGSVEGRAVAAEYDRTQRAL
jgi:hypothetical protein